MGKTNQQEWCFWMTNVLGINLARRRAHVLRRSRPSLNDPLALDGNGHTACCSANKEVCALDTRLLVVRHKCNNQNDDPNEHQRTDHPHPNEDEPAILPHHSLVLPREQGVLQRRLHVHCSKGERTVSQSPFSVKTWKNGILEHAFGCEKKKPVSTSSCDVMCGKSFQSTANESTQLGHSFHITFFHLSVCQ